MTFLTKVRVCVAAASVIGASSVVWAQQPADRPAGAPAYAATPAALAPEAPAAPADEAGGERPVPGDELIAGRPGFVESRGVVQQGFLQFEGGWGYTIDSLAITSTLPGATLRLGLGHGIELRGANLGFISESPLGTRGLAGPSGMSDAQLGAKIMLLSEPHAPFELAVEPMISMPTGGAAVSTSTYDPSLTFSAGRELPAGFDATGLVRASRLTIDGARVTQYAAGVSVAHDVFKPWTASAEVVVMSDPTAWGFSAALARRVSPHCQIDLELGHRLSAAAPTWTLGAGIVVR